MSIEESIQRRKYRAVKDLRRDKVEPSFVERAARLRELTQGRKQTPSEDIQREGRKER